MEARELNEEGLVVVLFGGELGLCGAQSRLVSADRAAFAALVDNHIALLRVGLAPNRREYSSAVVRTVARENIHVQ